MNLDAINDLDLLPVGACVCDTEGRIVRCNRRAIELWGGSPAHADELGLCWADGRTMSPAETPMRRAMRTGQPVRDCESMLGQPGGAWISLIHHAAPLRDAGGEVVGAIDCFELAESSVVRARELSSILDAIPAIVWIAHDPEGRKITGNRAAADFLRMTQDANMSVTGEKEGPVHFRVLDARGRDLEGEDLPVQAAARGRDLRDFEEQVIFADGSVRRLFGNAVPLRGPDGAARGSVAAFIDVTEHRHAQEELDDFFENAVVGCHWVGPDGVILRANQAELDLLGYRSEEYVGRHITDFHVDREVIDDILARLGRHEVVREQPARLRARDGSIKDVLIDSSVLVREGRFVHTRCFTRDVTTMRSAWEAQARLAAIVESSEDAIVSKTLQGIITSWNRSAERLFGYTATEAVGRSITMLIPPERLSEESEILSRISRGERVEHFETIRVRKDGSPISLSLTISPVRDLTGRIIGASKIARDITGHRRTQEERRLLLEREQEARQVAETLNEVGRALAGELDVQRLLQMVTDAATQLTGAHFGAFFYNAITTAGEAYSLYTISGVPRSAFERFPMPRNTPLFGPTFRGEGTMRLDDVRLDPRFGQVGPHYGLPAGHLPVVSYLAVPVTSRTREVLGGLFLGHPDPGRFREAHERLVEGLAAQAAVAIDNARLYGRAQEELARRRRAEEETRALNAALELRVQERTRSLEEMVRELDTFAYSVAHDLRAPLRAIHAFGQMLLEEVAPGLSDEQRMYLDYIIRAGGRMDLLISDLLAYSRVSREQIVIEPLDLESLVSASIAQVREELGGAPADLAVEGPIPPVLGHRLTLSQALLNLLRNAVKFVAPGALPRVRVRAEPHDGRVRLWVEDNGIGIAPEYHDRLFRIFERLHGHEEYPGTGVGLAIVRRGVERMGGRVGLTSQLGVGSRFFIDLQAPPSPDTSDALR